MKNRNAFTLVELIAVIVILSLILAVVLPKIFKTIDDSKKRSCDIQIEYIKDAAATYFTKYKYNLYKNNSSMTYDEASKTLNGADIQLYDLANTSLLKKNIVNPIDEKELSLTDTIVNVRYINNGLVYKVMILNNSTSLYEELKCEN